MTETKGYKDVGVVAVGWAMRMPVRVSTVEHYISGGGAWLRLIFSDSRFS